MAFPSLRPFAWLLSPGAGKEALDGDMVYPLSCNRRWCDYVPALLPFSLQLPLVLPLSTLPPSSSFYALGFSVTLPPSPFFLAPLRLFGTLPAWCCPCYKLLPAPPTTLLQVPKASSGKAALCPAPTRVLSWLCYDQEHFWDFWLAVSCGSPSPARGPGVVGLSPAWRLPSGFQESKVGSTWALLGGLASFMPADAQCWE